MKRILSCVLALTLIFTSLSATAIFAMAAETPTISFENVETENGETVSLQLSIKNNPGIAGLAVSLKYDADALTLIETKKGTLFSGFTAAKNFAWDESEDVTTDGVLATFTFAVSETATPGDYEIEVIVRSCTNENLDDVECNVQNGQVTVKLKPVAVTGVSLNKDTLSLDTDANNTATLVANVSPEASTNKAVTWKSSDESIATVNNGVVTAVKHGTTTITVKTVDGGFTDACVVTVSCAHTDKTPTVAKTANCQEGGWDAYSTCNDCGQLFAADGTTKINAIPTTSKNSNNHTNVQSFSADTATCVHQGNDAYKKCKDCGVITEGSDAKYFGAHNYGTLVPAVSEKHTTTELAPAVAAHYQCSVCQKYFTEAKVETTIEALTGTTPSHGYGNWVNTDAEQHWKECDCGNKNGTGIHNYEDGSCDTTCDTCGYVRVITHNYSTEWSSDGINHWRECACGAKIDEGVCSGGTVTCEKKAICSTCGKEYGSLAECQYVDKVSEQYLVSVATCTQKAIYKKSCSVCGSAHAAETFETGSIDEDNHVGDAYQFDETNHWMVCGCGIELESAVHTYGDWAVNKQATTTEKGLKEKTCSVCGHKVTEEIPVIIADDKAPQTGDNNSIYLIVLLLVVSGGFATITVKRRKSRVNF